MSEKIKTNSEKDSERLSIINLGQQVSGLVKSEPVEAKKIGYKEYHKNPLAIAYDLANAENKLRNTYQKNAHDKVGAFFAGQLKGEQEQESKNKIDKLANLVTNFNQEILQASYEKNEAWLEKNLALEAIERGYNEGLGLQEIIESNYSSEQIAEAFRDRETYFCCSDGRVVDSDSDYNKLGMAGGGILMFPKLPEENNASWLNRLSIDKGFEQFIEKLHQHKVKEVVSHEECGAARYVGGADRGDEDGVTLAKYIHFRLQNFDYKSPDQDVRYKHMTINGNGKAGEKMRKSFHDERMLLIDTTTNFDPEVFSFPSSFVVSSFKLGFGRAGLEKDLGFEISDLGDRLNNELKLLVGVAGQHGFKSKRFTKDKPFYIFVVADNEEYLEVLKRCAEAIAANTPSLAIKVDGFVNKKTAKISQKT